MNHLDQSLLRLFKAAAQAPREALAEPPCTLEGRVLADWRACAPDEGALLASLFRRAVVCASLVMLASIGWSRLGNNEDEAARAGVIAHYEIAMEVLP